MIRFDHVSKSYKGTPRPALDDITTEILRGEFVFVVGASGSGKSTFLRLILREEKVTRGKLHVLGQNLSNISNRKVPYFRRNVGVVFQDFRLLTNKTVFDNVAFTLKVIGKSNGYIHEAVPDVLAMVGLDGKAQRFPHELSGGEQQRVAIARAVVNKPQVLLADEPTGNLDPATSAGITAVLERINASGTTVVMATHEAALVDRLQKRVIELVNGTMIRDERHGGYGFTAATPILDARDRDDAAPADGASIIDEPPAPLPASAAKRAADDKGHHTKHTGRKAGKRAAKAQARAAAEAAPAVAPSTAAAQAPEPQRPIVPDPVPARSAAGGEASTVPPTRGAPPDARPSPSAVTASTPTIFPAAEPVTRSDDDLRPAAVPAASATEPADDDTPSLLDQVRVPDAGAVDELSLAERLGLRSGKHDHDDDSNQDVGPVS